MGVFVLRIGHRVGRDPRISTHCGLVARAFGAEGIIYAGEKDRKMLDSLKKVCESWGGGFSTTYEKSWKKVLRDWKGKVAHLTMYGLPVDSVAAEIRKKTESRDLLVVVGGEKVPWEVYEKADWNVSVTSQPHSEIAALALFLDRIFAGKELGKRFPGAQKEIVPQERGKKIAERKG